MPRRIIHIDMDCFYAAIEERDHPELRGEPVAVGGRSKRRGVLTTANYEARKFGARSAMPTFEALQRCPHLIIMPLRFEAYKRESRRVRAILRSYTELVEPLSLDEAYVDVSAIERPAGELASEIRRRIRQATGLRASAGVAPNKLLAKIASDWRKPNGQFEIKPEEVAAFMAPLPVSKIWGVGRKARERLAARGIETCAQMQQLSESELSGLFGKFGLDLYELCRGIDSRPVVPNRIRKSISCERTFSADLLTLDDCQQNAAEIFLELVEDFARMKEPREIAKAFVKLKYSDFSRASIERAGLPFELASFQRLLAEAHARRPDPVRLIGIGLRFAEPPSERPAALPQQLELPLELRAASRFPA